MLHQSQRRVLSRAVSFVGMSATLLIFQGEMGAALAAPLVVHQMANDIEIADAPDGAELETMGGDIRLGHVAGVATLRSMGGDVRVESAAGPVDASTMGGNITIGAVSGSLIAKTQGGNVSVASASGSVTATSAGGEIAVTAHSSAVPMQIALTTMGGGITLHLPHNFSGTIDASLTFTKNSRQDYHLTTPFNLTQTVTPEWDYSHGEARKTIHAVGSVGGGRDHVTVSATDGNIKIIGD